jgi:malonyl CoA-acyl carrier protein transacylase
LAGHSLGEFNALLAAGAFDFMTGLELVAKRGALMAEAPAGAMAAILGLTGERILSVLGDSALCDVEVSNYNTRHQTVISGSSSQISRASTLLKTAGAEHCIPLPVGGAFHSSFMTNAAAAFGDYVKPVRFASLQMPVVSNVTAQPYPGGDTAAMAALLVLQITSPVKWWQSIQMLLGAGISEFTELGPGTVLTRMIQQIRSDQES